MRHLNIQFPNAPELMQSLHTRVQMRDRAVLHKDGDCPYDGGADGGVVPDSMLTSQPPPQPQRQEPPARLQQTLPLILRQTHAPDKKGLHRWSLGLESKDGKLDSLSGVRAVRFELHPTFDPPDYRLSKPPFTVGPFLGWGTFDVSVHVE